MDTDKLKALLTAYKAGNTDLDGVLGKLKTLPYDDLGNYARLDMHRELRNGMPEVVLCESKTPEQSLAIMRRLWENHDQVLGTRVPDEMAAYIQEQMPEVQHDPTSRLIWLERNERPTHTKDEPYAMIVCGGTSDLPVAEEAAQVLEFLGHRVERAYDVGVAGLHRLLGEMDRLTKATVIIAVAGMEGALTSVVAGLVSAPVIGVPTSVGYGVNFAGVAPLLTMLNSCASGVTVVNIDNGFGAAVSAHLMLRQMK